MSLTSSLADVPVLQMLNLISLTHRTGTLMVTGAVETAQLAFVEGHLFYAATDLRPYDLLTMLKQNGQLTSREQASIRANTKTMAEGEMVGWLIYYGLTTHEELAVSVIQHTRSIIHDLITWQAGTSHFEDGDLACSHLYITCLDLNGLVDEGHYLMSVWENILESIQDLNYRLDPNPAYQERHMALTVPETDIIRMSENGLTLPEIKNSLQLEEAAIKAIVSRLLLLGLATITPVREKTIEVDEQERPLTLEKKVKAPAQFSSTPSVLMNAW